MAQEREAPRGAGPRREGDAVLLLAGLDRLCYVEGMKAIPYVVLAVGTALLVVAYAH
jgi:hypothetical protein